MQSSLALTQQSSDPLVILKFNLFLSKAQQDFAKKKKEWEEKYQEQLVSGLKMSSFVIRWTVYEGQYNRCSQLILIQVERMTNVSLAKHVVISVKTGKGDGHGHCKRSLLRVLFAVILVDHLKRRTKLATTEIMHQNVIKLRDNRQTGVTFDLFPFFRSLFRVITKKEFTKLNKTGKIRYQ